MTGPLIPPEDRFDVIGRLQGRLDEVSGRSLRDLAADRAATMNDPEKEFSKDTKEEGDKDDKDTKEHKDVDDKDGFVKEHGEKEFEFEGPFDDPAPPRPEYGGSGRPVM